MLDTLDFIITLPLKIIAAVTITVFFVVFGLLRLTGMMAIDYENWYDLNMEKLIRVIKWAKSFFAAGRCKLKDCCHDQSKTKNRVFAKNASGRFDTPRTPLRIHRIARQQTRVEQTWKDEALSAFDDKPKNDNEQRRRHGYYYSAYV